MSERAKIQDRLRKKEQEVQALDEKIKAARVYVQALRDVLKLLDMDEDEEEPVSPEATLRHGSLVARTREVIMFRGEPVHISDLLQALGKAPTRLNRASLTSSLAAYVRRDEIFTRPAPNTFGLIELGHTSLEREPDEPPNDFGIIRPKPEDEPDEIPF